MSQDPVFKIDEHGAITGTFLADTEVAAFSFDRFIHGGWDVHLEAELPCGKRRLKISFYMTRNRNDDWQRATTMPSSIADAVTGEEVWGKQERSYQNGSIVKGLTTQAIKSCTDAVKIGWCEFIRKHPEIYDEIYRQRAREHMMAHNGRAEAYRHLAEKEEQAAQLYQLAMEAVEPREPLKKADQFTHPDWIWE